MSTNGRLPQDSQRIMALVKRSIPKARRRLPDEYEEQLRETFAESAACYASMEDLSDRLDGIIEAVNDDGVVLEAMDDDDNSTVTHISEVKREISDSDAAMPLPPAPVRHITDG